jgi:uncharacterized membrane protein (DUF485 family)
MASGYKEIVGKRTVASNIARILFWGFNLLMIIWIWGGLATVETSSSAESIGVGIGVTMLVIIWVLGDIILGLFYFFTRPTRQLVKK